MSYARTFTRLAGTVTLLFLAALAPAAAEHRVAAEFEISQLTVVNGVAEATFKVVIKNEETYSLAGVWLVFDDGFEVSIGDVAAESSGASDSATRTFDLSQHISSLNVPLPATLKFAVDGSNVEQPTSIVLHLQE